MSISVDSSSDDTLNRDPLALLLRRQNEFPFGIDIVQFSIFNLFYLLLQRHCKLTEDLLISSRTLVM